MGMDIHIYWSDRNKRTKEIDFGGRNSEWFRSLQDEGDDVYDSLNIKYGVSPYLNDEIKKESDEFGYFGFHHVNVGEFRSWYFHHRPNITAGWVTTYEKWRYEKQGIVPSDPSPILDTNIPFEDQHFIELPNYDDCSEWLYHYIEDNRIPESADITYWFDC